jgi:hypothetical protein
LSQVRFTRVPETVPEKVSEKVSREGSGEGLGGFGTEVAQVQQGSGEVDGEGSGRFWYRSISGSIGFR